MMQTQEMVNLESEMVAYCEYCDYVHMFTPKETGLDTTGEIVVRYIGEICESEVVF